MHIHELFLSCGGDYPPYNGELDELFAERALKQELGVPLAPKHGIPESPSADSCAGSSVGTPMISANHMVGATPTSSILVKASRIYRPISGSMKRSK